VNPEKRKGNISLIRLIPAALGGTLVIYLTGVPFLKLRLAMEWPSALAAGLTPFLLGDVLKAVTAVILARLFIPRLYGEEK
jgi:biotin transport system substrate-specific component